MKPRNVHRWGPALAAGLLLSGCGLSDPGTAASVGDETISVAEVQRFTSAYCAFLAPGVASGQAQATTLADQKQSIVRALAEAAVASETAAEKGVETPAEVTQYLFSSLRTATAQVEDTGDREALTEFLRDYTEGQATIAALAADEAGQQLGPQNLDQFSQAGLQLLPTWVAATDVSIDPRYGLGDDLQPAAGDASVSQPVSDIAVQLAGSGQDGGPSAAEALPPSQRCGG